MRFEQQFVVEVYKEGSATCRNYSRLTQQVRVVTIIAIVLAIVKEKSLTDLIGKHTLGHVLYGLAFALALVAWHYQSAFTVIRNRLYEIEFDLELTGPWTGHKAIRGRWSDLLSTYVPFILMVGAGAWVIGWEYRGLFAVLPLLSIGFSMWKHGDRDQSWIMRKIS